MLCGGLEGRGVWGRISSVAQSCPTLQPHGPQHAKPPCPSPAPGVYSNSCALSCWCHPTILFSVISFSSCLQSFPASGSFQMSQLFTSGGWSIGVSASTSVLPMNTQDWSPLGWISFRMDLLAVQGTHKSLLEHHSSKASVLQHSAFFTALLSYPYMTTGKTIALTRWTFVGKVMSLIFNRLSRLVIAFLPRSNRLLISWLQSPPAVILEPQKIKVWLCFHYFPTYLPWSDGTRCHDLSFLNPIKPIFSLSSFTFIERLFSSSSLSAKRVVSSAIWGYWYFSQKSWFQLVFLSAQRFSWCPLHIS